MGVDDAFKLFDEYGVGEVIRDSDLRRYSPVMIDASVMIHRALKALKHVTTMTGPDGQPTGHIKNVLQNVIKFYINDCRVIFVFDGKAPELKSVELEERAKIKDDAKNELDKLQSLNDKLAEFCIDSSFTNIDKSMLEKRSLALTAELIAPIKSLLDALGVPYIQATEEADTTIRQLYDSGVSKCVWSTDSDMLVYGIPYLIRPVSVKHGNTKKSEMRLYSLQTVYNKLNINQGQLVAISICLGNDYDKGVKGIGIKKVMKLIVDGKLDSVVAKFTEHQLEVFRRFIKPPTYPIQYNMLDIDLNKLRELLISKGFGTADDYVKRLTELNFNYKKHMRS